MEEWIYIALFLDSVPAHIHIYKQENLLLPKIRKKTSRAVKLVEVGFIQQPFFLGNYEYFFAIKNPIDPLFAKQCVQESAEESFPFISKNQITTQIDKDD